MMPPLWSFDDVDERKRGQKKTDDLRAMTTLGPRTLPFNLTEENLQNFYNTFEQTFKREGLLYFLACNKKCVKLFPK